MKIIFILSIWIFSFASNSLENPPYEIVIFEGSDWCVNCIRLEENILSNPQFEAYIKEQNISLKRIDFPRNLKQSKETIKENNTLAEKFQFEGDFPKIILSSMESPDFVELDYNNKMSLKDFIEDLNELIEEEK